MGLRVSDVALDERLITVRATTSKTRRGRTVPISKATAKALRHWLRVRAAYEARRATQGGDALWVASKGVLTANGALQALHRRQRAAGVPQTSLHSLRHRMAAKAIERGLPMPYLVRIGGWANAQMPTNRYGQYGVEERAVSAMADLLDSHA
jgi:integrase